MLEVAVASFLVGSVPFGYLIGRLFYRTDIRVEGSGNIGAMNALRTLGKAGAVAVLLLDAGKGLCAVLLTMLWLHAMPWAQTATSLAAACAVMGHCFSPWLGWRGGKGVATSFGAIFGLAWPVGLIAVGGWLLGVLATRYSSVGSMLGSVLAPVGFWLLTRSVPETVYAAFAAVLIFYTHRANIGRLRAGTESSIRGKMHSESQGR